MSTISILSYLDETKTKCNESKNKDEEEDMN